MRSRRFLLFAASTVSVASILALGLSGAAEAAPTHLSAPAVMHGGGSFDLYAGDSAVELYGTVTFNSDGSATIRAKGADNKADGYGPYLEVNLYNSNQVKISTAFKSCSIGAGGVCTLPTYVTPSNPRVDWVELYAATGSGGNLHSVGQRYMFLR